ncbi:MAG TPA: pirin family protein [Candidatus Tidjanibacter gallistercoris]|nr:pirin family protein [Candidatus Tidjanibacter gallistercoris]
MKKTVHRAESRGHFDHGWLDTYHTFSFARYYDPHRVHFGALRVLNDDTVQGGEGFGTHSHENMEIVSIPLEGILEHGDSMGNNGRQLRPGEIQVMSAGTGIRHSEFNGSTAAPVRFLQIWVIPERRGLTPRYENIRLEEAVRGRLQPIVAPYGHGSRHVGWIHQRAWFYLGTLDAGQSVVHRLHAQEHGVYLFVIEGTVNAAGETLGRRDGIGISDTASVEVTTGTPARILLMEVPMNW